MKKLPTIVLVLVVLLSIAASVPKLLRASQEVAFFEGAGLSANVVLFFGALQLLAGILLVFQVTRAWGAAAAGVMFLGSAIMMFMSGNTAFGSVSLIPVLMAGFVLKESANRADDAEAQDD